MTMSNELPSLKNDLLMKIINGSPVPRLPCWIMRQAGRYLEGIKFASKIESFVEFRNVRKSNDFFTICQTPELASEVTMQPLRRFSFDASIIFSDILVIPQALGMQVLMLESKGPHFPEPLISPKDLEKLNKNVNVKDVLGYVFEAIRITRIQINGDVPLFGFAGAPWTIMSYMIEGGGSKMFTKVKRWINLYPDASHELLQKITDLTIDYLIEQVNAGAQILQVFDSWAGELSPADFLIFSLPYLKQIGERVKEKLGENAVPMVVFAKGAHQSLEELFKTNYDVIGLDYSFSIPSVKSRLSKYNEVLKSQNKPLRRVTFQGNMDPGVLHGSSERVAEVCELMVREMLDKKDGEMCSWICNLGHGIQPETPIENVATFLATIKRVSEEILK